MASFAAHRVTPDEMGERMNEVRADFLKLMTNEKGEIVFNQDVPTWLNLFLANRFIDWDRKRQTINAARQRPDMTSSPDWERVETFERESNESFRQVCSHIVASQKPKKRSWFSRLFSWNTKDTTY